MDFKEVIKELKIGRQLDQYLAENKRNQDEAIQKELASLNKMFGAFFASQKPTGDDLEEKREKREKKATEQKAKNKPKNFKEGFFAGTGLDGILGGIKDLASAAFAPFAGALGGVSIGALMGKALGVTFMGVVGAIFGATLLDKWVDPLVDKITGDDATATTMFGEIDISKIVSGIGGALALIFGPRLLSAVIGSYFTDIGGKEGGAKYRLMFLRRLGLAGLILTAASFSGEWLQGLGMGEGLSGAVSMALTAAGIGFMLLGGKGLIIGAIAGFAIGAVKGIYNYLNEKGKEAEEIVMKKTKENVDAIADALKEGDEELANKKAREISGNIAMLDYNMRAGTTYTDFLSAQGLKFRDEATAAMLAAGQASKDTGLINAANKYRADMMGDNAANVSNQDFMAELKNATKGMDRPEIEYYLANLASELSSGFVNNLEQQRLIDQVYGDADTYDNLVNSLVGSAGMPFDMSQGMGAHERGREAYLLPVIENNTGVIDKFNTIIARMLESHSLTQDSLIGRMMGAGQDLIPAEAQGGGGYATYTNIEGSTSTTNNQGVVTGDPRPFDRLVSGY
mgnify:CR=1 FL=1